MKRLALALAGLLVVALCFTVARHISDTLMAVIVGIVMGIGASIPMVLVVIWMMRQQEQADEEQERERVRLSRPAQLTVNIYGPVQMGPGRMANVLPPTSWSGPGARPAHLDWFRSARDQCQETGVPFFLKSINAKHERELDGSEWNKKP